MLNIEFNSKIKAQLFKANQAIKNIYSSFYIGVDGTIHGTTLEGIRGCIKIEFPELIDAVSKDNDEFRLLFRTEFLFRAFKNIPRKTMVGITGIGNKIVLKCEDDSEMYIGDIIPIMNFPCIDIGCDIKAIIPESIIEKVLENEIQRIYIEGFKLRISKEIIPEIKKPRDVEFLIKDIDDDLYTGTFVSYREDNKITIYRQYTFIKF